MRTILLPTLGILAVLVLVSAQNASAMSPGGQAAVQDWQSGVGYHGSCAEHGIDVSQNNELFCVQFKLDYALEWAVLSAGR